MDATTVGITRPQSGALTNSRGSRFYRPELDALRFFAFTCVLVHHGVGAGPRFRLVKEAGGFGLSLFFLLSAYLITELLLKEREEWGTIHLKSFYARRILRIWPLYYVALLGAILIGNNPRIRYTISHTAIVGFALFVENWLSPLVLKGLCGPMWSISIEEQFYLIWPFIAKLRGGISVIAAAATLIMGSVVAIALLPSRELLWYNTFVEFLFFGTGALLAVALRRKPLKLTTLWRLLFLAAGLGAWAVGTGIGTVGTSGIQGQPISHYYLGYGAADLGCVLIFLSFLGVSALPEPIIYFGKISYGLYVFHWAFLRLSLWLLGGMMAASLLSTVWKLVAIDGLTFILCLATASLSYRFLEKPFLQLKEKFAYIKSRPVDDTPRSDSAPRTMAASN